MTGNSAEAAYPGRPTGGATRATRHPAALLLIAACSAALALAGCARTTGGVAGGTTSSSAGADTGVAAQSAQPDASRSAGNGGTGNGGSSGGTGNSNGGTPTWKPSASASAASGPQIVYFKVEGSAACPENGGPGFSSPGGVTLTWKVTGATKVALSIDDPNFYAQYGSGSYGSYGPTDTLNLSFGCSVPIGQTQTHTYTLDTMDGGAHRSMTIKASAVNHG